jgi:hypothetical protein
MPADCLVGETKNERLPAGGANELIGGRVTAEDDAIGAAAAAAVARSDIVKEAEPFTGVIMKPPDELGSAGGGVLAK